MSFCRAKLIFQKLQFTLILISFLQILSSNAFGQSGDCKIGVKIADGNYTNNYFYPFQSGVFTINLCIGSSISLIAESKTNTKYQWFMNANRLIDSTSASIRIMEPGEYYVNTIDNSNNCISNSMHFKIENVDKISNYKIEFDGALNENNENVICGKFGYIIGEFNNILRYQKPKLILLKNGIVANEYENYSYLRIEGAGDYQVISKFGECQASSNTIKISQGNQNDFYKNGLTNEQIKKTNGLIDTLNTIGCKTYFEFPNKTIFNTLIVTKNGIPYNWESASNLYSNMPSINNIGIGKYIIEYKNQDDCKIRDSVFVKNVKLDRNIKFKIIKDQYFDNYLSIDAKIEIPNKIKWYKNGGFIRENSILYLGTSASAKYKAVIEFENCDSFETEEYEYNPQKINFKIFNEKDKNNKSFVICGNTNISFNFDNYALSKYIDLYKNGNLYKTNPPIDFNKARDNLDLFTVSETGYYYAKIRDTGQYEIVSDTIQIKVLDSIPTQINLTKQNFKSIISTKKTDGVKYQWYLDG